MKNYYYDNCNPYMLRNNENSYFSNLMKSENKIENEIDFSPFSIKTITKNIIEAPVKKKEKV